MAIVIGGNISVGNGISISSEFRQAVAFAHNVSPYISVYPWTDAAGFGAKYSNPATMATSDGNQVDFHPTGLSVALCTNNEINVYPWDMSTGFGAMYSNAGILAGAVSLKFSTTGGALAVGDAGSPYLHVYHWSNSTGFGALYTNAGNPKAAVLNGIAFSPAGDAVITSSGGALAGGYLSGWPWSDSTGFGTKYTSPNTSADGVGSSATFHPAGNVAAYGYFGGFAAFHWDSTTGFGTRYADPGTPMSSGNGIVFSPGGSAFLTARTSSPYIDAWAWNYTTGFGARYSNPATLPSASRGNAIDFNATGTTVFLGQSGSPYVTAYPWNDSTGFGTKYSDPSTLPTNNVFGVSASPLV